MSTFLSSISSEAERLRASRDAVHPLMAEFRRHPKSQWRTLYVELGLALEKEIDETSSAAPTPRASVPAKANGAAAKPSQAEEMPAEGSKTKVAQILFSTTTRGFNAVELGEALYGDDPRAANKARAVVHHLQNKWQMPIVRDEHSGRWVLNGG